MASETANCNTDEEFLTAAEAIALTGWSRTRLFRVVAGNYIAVWQLPGSRRRYSRNDLLRVAREAIRPATASLSGK